MLARLRPPVALLVLTATLAGAAASPAGASDATLRDQVAEVLVELHPVAAEFQDAARGLRTAQDTTRLQHATDAFRIGMRRYRWAVTNRKASSAPGLAAKRRLLHAIRTYDSGLARYEHALTLLHRGSTRAPVVAQLDAADARFTRAAKGEAAALAALGVDPAA